MAEQYISCAAYAALHPERFPAENGYGEQIEADEFATFFGRVLVCKGYHLYVAPGPGEYPRFDNVDRFLWSRSA